MKYFLVVGEASGDLHASNLMKELLKLDARAEFRFFGGDKMLAIGGHIVKHYRDMAFMGVIDVVLNARTVLSNLSLCKLEISNWKPDVLILVDYASFNLRIAEYVKKNIKDLPVHFYISPKIWAWKEYRIKYFKRYIDKMYVILPFEKDFFAKHDFPVTYVGNPCLDSVTDYHLNEKTGKISLRERAGLDKKPVIALLPGSRKGEIERNLPLMFQVASQYDKFQVVVAGAPGVEPDFYNKLLPEKSKLLFGETYGLLENAYAAIVTSGTATLETALFLTPQVVCYAAFGGHISNWIFRTFMHVPYFSLVNLIADRMVVPELLAALFTKVHLTAAIEPLLSETPERSLMIEGYKEINKKLGLPGAAKKTATLIFSSINLE